MWSVHRRVLRIQEGLGDRLEGSQGGFGPREMHWDDTGSRADPHRSPSQAQLTIGPEDNLLVPLRYPRQTMPSLYLNLIHFI